MLRAFRLRFLYGGPVNATTMTAQIRFTRSSPECWRATFDHPASNLMGPDFVPQFRQIMTVLETDAQTRVIVFGSAVEGFFSTTLISSPGSRA